MPTNLGISAALEADYERIPAPPWFRVFTPGGTEVACAWVSIVGFIGFDSSQPYDQLRGLILVREGKEGEYLQELNCPASRFDEGGEIFRFQDEVFGQLIIQSTADQLLELAILPEPLEVIVSPKTRRIITSAPIQKKGNKSEKRNKILALLTILLTLSIAWVLVYSSGENAAIAAKTFSIAVSAKDGLAIELLVKPEDPISKGEKIARRIDPKLLTEFQKFENDRIQAMAEKKAAEDELVVLRQQLQAQKPAVVINQKAMDVGNSLVQQGFARDTWLQQRQTALSSTQVNYLEIEKKMVPLRNTIDAIGLKWGTKFVKSGREKEAYLAKIAALDVVSPCNCMVRRIDPQSFDGTTVLLVESDPDLYIEAVVPRDKLTEFAPNRSISYRLAGETNYRSGTYVGLQEKPIGRIGVDDGWFVQSKNAIIKIKSDTPIQGGAKSVGMPVSVMYSNNRIPWLWARIIGTF